MKKKYAKYLIGIVISIAAILYLKHRHEQALIDQKETPTDSDCCWEGETCDSIQIITDSLEIETDSLNLK